MELFDSRSIVQAIKRCGIAFIAVPHFARLPLLAVAIRPNQTFDIQRLKDVHHQSPTAHLTIVRVGSNFTSTSDSGTEKQLGVSKACGYRN